MATRRRPPATDHRRAPSPDDQRPGLPGELRPHGPGDTHALRVPGRGHLRRPDPTSPRAGDQVVLCQRVNEPVVLDAVPGRARRPPGLPPLPRRGPLPPNRDGERGVGAGPRRHPGGLVLHVRHGPGLGPAGVALPARRRLDRRAGAARRMGRLQPHARPHRAPGPLRRPVVVECRLARQPRRPHPPRPARRRILGQRLPGPTRRRRPLLRPGGGPTRRERARDRVPHGPLPPLHSHSLPAQPATERSPPATEGSLCEAQPSPPATEGSLCEAQPSPPATEGSLCEAQPSPPATEGSPPAGRRPPLRGAAEPTCDRREPSCDRREPSCGRRPRRLRTK